MTKEKPLIEKRKVLRKALMNTGKKLDLVDYIFNKIAQQDKEAVENAEDFVISMKRDDDLQWNMRLNLIIEEFKKNIFGEFK